MTIDLQTFIESQVANIEGLSEKDKSRLRDEISCRLVAHACLRREYRPEYKSICLQPAPISIFPVPIKRSLYTTGWIYGPLFNSLCDSMVTNLTWLLSAYEGVRKVDDFVDRFCAITERVYVTGNKDINKCMRAYVTRSDYLVDRESQSFKQVEINLSSVVGPHIMNELSTIQRDLLPEEHRHALPENEPRAIFGKRMKTLSQAYAKHVSSVCQGGCAVLFLTGEAESNMPEMLHMIKAMTTEGLEVHIASFDGMVRAMLNGSVKQEECEKHLRLLVDLGDVIGFPYAQGSWRELSCVYMRTGYRPEQYLTEDYWVLRELLERTEAIVIPSAVSQLAGLKKVQQLWCIDSNLETLVPDDDERKFLAQCFCPQVDPSDPNAQETVDDALENCGNYVLKPQREGGGNNTYGKDIVGLLSSERRREISSYVLMKRIFAPEHDCIFLRDGKLEFQRCISEFGFYAAGLWVGADCIFNETFGHLVRSKEAGSDEGGVSINVAVFNSLVVVD